MIIVLRVCSVSTSLMEFPTYSQNYWIQFKKMECSLFVEIKKRQKVERRLYQKLFDEQQRLEKKVEKSRKNF